MEEARPAIAPGSGPAALPRAPLAAPRPALPARLQRGWQQALRGAGARGEVVRVGSVLWPCLQDTPPRRYDRIDPAGTQTYATTHRRMLARGVWLAPSYYEVAFVGTAHDEAAVDSAAAALAAALAGD